MGNSDNFYDKAEYDRIVAGCEAFSEAVEMVSKKSGPTIARGKSQQDIETPWEFIRAVEEKFGPLRIDLAGTNENKKAPVAITPEQDSLSIPWHVFLWCEGPPSYEMGKPLLWLNPPFDPITPWVRKCAEESALGAHLLLLAPASVGSNWYWNWVQHYATVYCLTPRLKFVGHKDVYPKDLILADYHLGAGNVPLVHWRWK